MTAWWGLVAPRTRETRPLTVVQGVVLRPAARDGAGDREVLLSIRSDLFGWELPGGTPERGETREQTLAREIAEETGLEVEVETHVGDWVRSGFRPHTARIYLCRVVGGRARPSSETPRVGWFPAGAPPASLFPWYREPLRRALAGEQGLRVEERQGPRFIFGAMWIDLRMRWRGLPAPSEPDSGAD